MKSLMDYLNMIVDHNQLIVRNDRRSKPLSHLKRTIAGLPPPRDFLAPFRDCRRVRVIAELKKASPSKGLIRDDFPVEALAGALAEAGAAALSVLTEPYYFRGSTENLQLAARTVDIPLLRKDFIFDPYQIYQARALGADAVLLIAAILNPARFDFLLKLTHELGMTALCEIHTESELETVLNSGAELIGINCRNLRSFVTDLEIVRHLLDLIPDDKLVIAESGIHNRRDLDRLRDAGADGFLIGEALMRAEKPGEKLREFIR